MCEQTNHRSVVKWIAGEIVKNIYIFAALVLFNTNAYCQIEKIVEKEKAPPIHVKKGADATHANFKELKNQLLQLNEKVDKLLKKKDDNSLTYITPILVAFFAGFLALLQVKSNTISTSRISWIENLRTSLSKFVGEGLIMNFHFVKARDLRLEGQEEESRKLYEETVPQTIKMAELSYKIRLYLSPTEKSHIELESLLRMFERLAIGNFHDVAKSDELYKVTEEVISSAKEILKATWEDAKSIKISDLINFKY